jgi:hypothetical protein
MAPTQAREKEIFVRQSQNRMRARQNKATTGYRNPDYARSLAEFGTPRSLPGSGGWILERPLEGFPYHDAMGCYPIFSCQNWSQLHIDLAEIENELVSLTLVTDPFGDYKEDYLQRCFPDKCTPFKEHFVIDLKHSAKDIMSKHHRYYARKALEHVHVEVLPDTVRFLDTWFSLYSELIERHNIDGIQAFSRKAFAKQLSIPGLVIFRAEAEGKTVGAHLWYIQGHVAHSHLAASSALGYDLMASYALHKFAIEYLSDKVRWLSLGAGAGAKGDAEDGLSQFKRGWATGTRDVYLCGRIFNERKYAEIVEARKIPDTNYFPAYRSGEFV